MSFYLVRSRAPPGRHPSVKQNPIIDTDIPRSRTDIIGPMAQLTFCFTAILAWSLGTAAAAQTPQPFPRPGDPARPQPAPPATQPAPATPLPGDVAILPPQTSSPGADAVPTEASLGVTIYPGAQFITSYDAGRGQRYYLFGTNASFPEIVVYYRTMLKQRGELTFEQPPIHSFEVGRFREETMAFPPSVTVKDYTWGGAAGYMNPKPGGQPASFRTIIQIVPAPPTAPGAKR